MMKLEVLSPKFFFGSWKASPGMETYAPDTKYKVYINVLSYNTAKGKLTSIKVNNILSNLILKGEDEHQDRPLFSTS